MDRRTEKKMETTGLCPIASETGALAILNSWSAEDAGKAFELSPEGLARQSAIQGPRV